MTHYPHQEGPVVDEFGLAPHTDTSFLTLLAPNDVPGLSIRTQSGNWIDAPAIEDAYVVNGGQMLQRWTNDLFLATPHRAINRSGGERYAIPFFCDSNIDWPVAAVPTTVGPDKPPKYPTTYYSDYMIWYQKRNYDVLNDAAGGRLSVEFQSVVPILRIFSVEKAREFYVDFLGFTWDWEHRFDDDAPLYAQVSRSRRRAASQRASRRRLARRAHPYPHDGHRRPAPRAQREEVSLRHGPASRSSRGAPAPSRPTIRSATG